MPSTISSSLKYGIAVIAGVAIATTVNVFGGSVPTLTTFQNGAVADADELNQNLADLKAAIDDNFARIEDLEDRSDETTTFLTQSGELPGNGVVVVTSECPSAYPVAVSCGVDVFSPASMTVAALAPQINGNRPFFGDLGTDYTTALDGCWAVVRNEDNNSVSGAAVLVTTCRQAEPAGRAQ